MLLVEFRVKTLTISCQFRHEKLSGMECEIFNRFVSFSKEEHKYLDNSDNEWLKHSTKDVNKAGDQEKN